MDKFSRRLQSDADNIEVAVSSELDARIQASLHAISQEPAARPKAPARPISMWWASSITGIAAAVAMINYQYAGTCAQIGNGTCKYSSDVARNGLEREISRADQPTTAGV